MLRRILGLAHIPNISSNSGNFSKCLGDLPLRTQGSSGNTKSAVFGGPDLPCLTAGVTSGSTSLTWVLNSAKLVEGTPKRSWMGVRFKWSAVGSDNVAFSSVMLAAYGWTINDSNRTVLMTTGDIVGDLATALNKEFYVEFCFNWQTGVVERRVDGQPLSDISISPAAVLSLFNARNVGIFLFAANGANTQRLISDIYWVDDTEDSSINRFLGPQRIVKAALTAQASGWPGTSGATENTVINTAVSATTPDTPVITSPVPATPLNITVGQPAPTAGKINGISLYSGLNRTSGSATNVKAKVSYDGQDSSEITVTTQAAMTHGVHLRTLEKAPGDVELNAAVVGQLTVALTPVD